MWPSGNLLKGCCSEPPETFFYRWSSNFATWQGAQLKKCQALQNMADFSWKDPFQRIGPHSTRPNQCRIQHTNKNKIRMMCVCAASMKDTSDKKSWHQTIDWSLPAAWTRCKVPDSWPKWSCRWPKNKPFSSRTSKLIPNQIPVTYKNNEQLDSLLHRRAHWLPTATELSTRLWWFNFPLTSESSPSPPY